MVEGARLRAAWFNPRVGRTVYLGTSVNLGEWTFTAPSSGRGHDWVLVLDDVSRESLSPGNAP
jgi:hypothetical protein